MSYGPIVLVLRDVAGVIINLTGFTCRWIARPEVPSPNEYDLDAAITNAAGGEITSEFTDEETMRLFPAGNYQHALTVTNGSGAVLGPQIIGPLLVEDQSARP